MIVASRGFAEAGADGTARQRRAGRGVPRRGDAAGRPQQHGRDQPRPCGAPQRDVRHGGPGPWRGRASCRRAERSGSRSSIMRTARAWGSRLHRHRQQGGPVRQRLPPVLGGGPVLLRDRAVPGVAGQPAQVQPDRPARGTHQARHRREERALGRWCPGNHVAHRGAHRPVRHHGRGALPAGGRRADRYLGRVLRRCCPARRAAAAQGEPRCHPDQRGRPRDPRGGRL